MPTPSSASSTAVPLQAPQVPLEPAQAARAERDAALAALVQQAAAGSSSAFEAFYDQSFGYVQALARRVLRNAGDIEEVLSAAYFQAWRELARFDPQRGSAITWLLTIVRTRALDALRQARAAAEPLDDAAEGDAVADDAPGPQELLETAQAGTQLHAALARLGAQERWVLGLAYLRDLSHAQIAEATGLPLGSVKSLIFRAQGKLREMLAPPPLQKLS